MSKPTKAREGTALVGSARVAELRGRAQALPGTREEVTAIRAEMDREDRVYLESLASLRRVADLTQVALAERMGIAQNEVSRIERQHDWLLSTLGKYLGELGQDPRLLLTVDGRDVELDLLALIGK